MLPQAAFEDWRIVQDANAEPLERLRASDSLRRVLRATEGTIADLARREGKTWEEIGSAIGVSDQAAHQRYSG